MTRDEIIRMAREAGWPASVLHPHGPGVDTSEYLLVPTLERFARLAFAAGEQAERDRTARLVTDMQAELQTLRERLARQRAVLWRLKDNPTITVEGRPSNPGPWEALGPIV